MYIYNIYIYACMCVCSMPLLLRCNNVKTNNNIIPNIIKLKYLTKYHILIEIYIYIYKTSIDVIQMFVKYNITSQMHFVLIS